MIAIEWAASIACLSFAAGVIAQHLYARRSRGAPTDDLSGPIELDWMDGARPSPWAGNFRKRPVVVQAWRFERTFVEPSDPRWLRMAVYRKDIEFVGRAFIDGKAEHPYASIATLEGRMKAELGDWIICGVKGELYPCKPDIFAATYEVA